MESKTRLFIFLLLLSHTLPMSSLSPSPKSSPSLPVSSLPPKHSPTLPVSTPTPKHSPTPPVSTPTPKHSPTSPVSTPTPKHSPTPPVSTPTPKHSPISPVSSPNPKPKPSPSSSASTLDPKQVRALESLDIPTSKDPCSRPSRNNATVCDSAKPFRHLISLQLSNCSDEAQISSTALKSLSTLKDLSFINCPLNPVPLPLDLALNLHSFTCIKSLRHLTGVWLSRLQNLTDLTLLDVTINASGPTIILSSMKKLGSVKMSNTNLTGYLPKKWHSNITSIDLSKNRLKGRVPISLTQLADLTFLNLSSNGLSGELPDTFGDLIALKNVSLANNSLSGPIPDTMSAIRSLTHIDLSSNQFNGSVPKFFAEMKGLKHLNLENNNFQGVLPFNGSSIQRLAALKLSGNSNLCYNHSLISKKVKLGIAPCDKNGFPVSPPPDHSSSADSSSDDGDYTDNPDEDQPKHKSGHHHHGPNKVVLGVAIALSSILFLIIFLILLSKWCA